MWAAYLQQDGLICRKEVPKWTKEVPKRTLEVPKCTQKVPKCTQEVPKCTHEVPKCTHEVPKCTLEVPKCTQKVPQCTQNVPKCTQEVPKCTIFIFATSNTHQLLSVIDEYMCHIDSHKADSNLGEYNLLFCLYFEIWISEVTFEIFSLASLSALLISRLNNIVRLFFPMQYR